MRSASDHLAKRAAFDQMRNVWLNARAFGQMRSAFDQCRTPKFKPAAAPLTNCAAHLANGTSEARKPCDTQLGGTGATHCMVSRRRVSRR